MMWVNAYRENGRQQNKAVGAPLLANRENERPHEVKTTTDIYAYRETAARFHMVNAWPDCQCDQNLSPRVRWLLERMWQEWQQMEIEIKAITDEIERISNENALCRRLRQIPGFGPLVSTATVAAIGNGAAFRRVVTSRPGLASCHGSTPPGASRSCSASANAATSICVASLTVAET